VHGLTILIRAEKSYECVCLYVNIEDIMRKSRKSLHDVQLDHVFSSIFFLQVISQIATKSFTTLQLAVKIAQSNENNLKTSDSR
jgi:hypothetical protein